MPDEFYHPLGRSPSPIPSTSPTPSTYRSVLQHFAEAALADPKRLHLLYTSLRAAYSNARQTILCQAEELASLKGFLSKTDDWSGAQLLQALADLNLEIIQLSASVAEEFATNARVDTRVTVIAKERDREIVRPALGREMIKLLEEREHAQDPTLVLFALQPWEVCAKPTTSRWRALTYKHARSLLTRRTDFSEPSSPDTVTPSPLNSAPSSIASASSVPPRTTGPATSFLFPLSANLLYIYGRGALSHGSIVFAPTTDRSIPEGNLRVDITPQFETDVALALANICVAATRRVDAGRRSATTP
ncbi:hypothetical protein BD310DRAFT_982378 [Dichomitus squalens]|uniref:Uncharacterized protein n=1 Tax=Dichomitus squalens TaxID=114155 RepID=A0A4Q9PF81_9APHY|nr:hypothetical protein BD310DRAFT_982378 [Dichomitus squalens]